MVAGVVVSHPKGELTICGCRGRGRPKGVLTICGCRGRGRPQGVVTICGCRGRGRPEGVLTTCGGRGRVRPRGCSQSEVVAVVAPRRGGLWGGFLVGVENEKRCAGCIKAGRALKCWV